MVTLRFLLVTGTAGDYDGVNSGAFVKRMIAKVRIDKIREGLPSKGTASWVLSSISRTLLHA